MSERTESPKAAFQGLAILTLAVGINGIIDSPGVISGGLIAIGVSATVAGVVFTDLSTVGVAKVIEKGVLGAGILFFTSPLPSRFGVSTPAQPVLGSILVFAGVLLSGSRRILTD